MNEPFTCPNSSDSMSSEGMAAQFTSTNARLARGDSRCTARATSSLPVPFSPVISRRAGVGATFSIRSITCWMAKDDPTISWRCSTAALRARTSRSSTTCCRAFLSVSSTRWLSSGFSRKSCAPSCVASTAVAIVPCPEIITTSACASVSRSRLNTASPSIPAILTSSSTRCGLNSAYAPSASGPELASATV